MNFTQETSSYNERRYGQPWIAKVDFSDTKGNFSFGDWTGDKWNGGEGVLSIEANTGDIIATGQNDMRKPRNSAPDFFVMTEAGNLDSLGDKGAAYKFFLAQKEKGIDVDALNIEKARLLARVEEINQILSNQ